MSFYKIWVSPFISDGCPYKEKDLETHRDIEGHEDEGRDGDDAATSQGMLRLLATTISQKNLGGSMALLLP